MSLLGCSLLFLPNGCAPNTLVEKPSDGVILAESSQYLTGSTQDDVKLKNSSHMQMRNDENMRDALQNLFTNPAYGEFWNIEAR